MILYFKYFREQCSSLISGYFRTSCRTGEGIEEMFNEVASTLLENCRPRLELNRLDRHEESFQVFDCNLAEAQEDNCAC